MLLSISYVCSGHFCIFSGEMFVWILHTFFPVGLLACFNFTHVCLHLCLCVCAHMHMCLHTQRPETGTQYPPLSLFPCPSRVGLSQNPGFLIEAESQQLLSILLKLEFQACARHWSCCVWVLGSAGTQPHPHDCAASTLSCGAIFPVSGLLIFLLPL